MRRVLELLLLFLPSPIPQILVSFSLFFSIHFTSLHFVSFHPFIAPPPPPKPQNSASASRQHTRQRTLLSTRNGQAIYALDLDPHLAVSAVVAR